MEPPSIVLLVRWHVLELPRSAAPPTAAKLLLPPPSSLMGTNRESNHAFCAFTKELLLNS
jgi:hypothetical protein